MKVQEKFNKRVASLVKTGDPTVKSGHGCAGGVQVKFFETDGSRELSVFMTPDEALLFAELLLRGVRHYRS